MFFSLIIWLVKENSNIFLWINVFNNRVEIGIQPSYPEQLKGWQLSFYPWRSVLLFVISFHPRQQRHLRNVLKYAFSVLLSEHQGHSFFYHISEAIRNLSIQPRRRHCIWFTDKEIGLGNSKRTRAEAIRFNLWNIHKLFNFWDPVKPLVK